MRINGINSGYSCEHWLFGYRLDNAVQTLTPFSLHWLVALIQTNDCLAVVALQRHYIATKHDNADKLKIKNQFN